MKPTTVWNYVQVGFTGIGGFLGWVLGGLDGFIYALIVFAVIDYITGIICAVFEKTLSSEECFRGIFKKAMIFAIVALGHMIDTHIIGPVGIVGDYSAIRTAIIFFYLANEGLSMLEHASRLGLPIPQKLKDILAQLNNKSNNKNEEE